VGEFVRGADSGNKYIPLVETILNTKQDKVVDTKLGQAVLHVLPGIGELHQKINPITDLGKSAWRQILLEPLQEAALGN